MSLLTRKVQGIQKEKLVYRSQIEPDQQTHVLASSTLVGQNYYHKSQCPTRTLCKCCEVSLASAVRRLHRKARLGIQGTSCSSGILNSSHQPCQRAWAQKGYNLPWLPHRDLANDSFGNCLYRSTKDWSGCTQCALVKSARASKLIRRAHVVWFLQLPE